MTLTQPRDGKSQIEATASNVEGSENVRETDKVLYSRHVHDLDSAISLGEEDPSASSRRADDRTRSDMPRTKVLSHFHIPHRPRREIEGSRRNRW